MKSINKKIIIFILITIVLIITIIFVLLHRNTKTPESIVYIDGVAFTLNDIKDKFLESSYAEDNNCWGTVAEQTLSLTCNGDTYEFIFNDYELELDSNLTDSTELFKYLVNAIQELHGYEKDEYLVTIDKFLTGKTAITGLEYTNTDDNMHYSVYVLEPLDKYMVDEVITNETIKNIIEESNYEFQSLGYTINNIELTKDAEEYLVIFSGIIGGQDSYNVIFNINYYDDENNLVTTESMDLSTHDPYGNPYLGFVVTARLEDQDTFDRITKYSISLSEVGE